MKKVILLTIFAFSAVLLVSCGGGDSKTPEVNTPAPPNEPEPIILPAVNDYQLTNTDLLLEQTTARLSNLSFDAFVDEVFNAMSERNVENLITDGRFELLALETAQLNNISDDFNRQSGQLFAHILSLLMAFDKSALSTQQQVSYDVLTKDLNYKIGWIDHLSFNYPATYGFWGWQGKTETFFTQAFTFTNLAQAELYLTLLNQIERRFGQVEALLDARAADGVIEPAWTLGYSQSLAQGLANQTALQTSYYQAFKNQLDTLDNISSDDKQQLLARLEATVEQRVLPAYQKLADKMNQMLPMAPGEIGFAQFEGGQAFYQFTLSFFTNSDLTAEQVHQMGMDELARIHQEMRALFDQLNYPQGETIAQLYSRVNSDAPLIPSSEVKSTYEQLIAQAYTELPSLFNTLPEQEVVVIGGTSGGYYIAGSDDGSRPGAFYANTSSDQPYTTMPTLAYHEAVPGHHLQIALANELNLPVFRRKAHFTSYIEGWGLYAERLAKDVGWYENDIYGDLGRLQFEAMRAARLVVDTGIHHYGWSNEQANNFHMENVGFNGSIARYSVWPGQATAYMVGMLKILQLREQAQLALGENYNMRDFHDVVLNSGAVPLDVLETLVEDYITQKRLMN